MPHTQILESAREFVTHTWEEMGADLSCTREETIMIRDGYYCGRRFRCDGLLAVWFIEENEIKFYDRAGKVNRVSELPRTIDIGEYETRRAA